MILFYVTLSVVGFFLLLAFSISILLWWGLYRLCTFQMDRGQTAVQPGEVPEAERHEPESQPPRFYWRGLKRA